jgi:hypothetical protein
MCAVPLAQPVTNAPQTVSEDCYSIIILCSACLGRRTTVYSVSVMEMDRCDLILELTVFSTAAFPKMQFSVTLHGVLG